MEQTPQFSRFVGRRYTWLFSQRGRAGRCVLCVSGLFALAEGAASLWESSLTCNVSCRCIRLCKITSGSIPHGPNSSTVTTDKTFLQFHCAQTQSPADKLFCYDGSFQGAVYDFSKSVTVAVVPTFVTTLRLPFRNSHSTGSVTVLGFMARYTTFRNPARSQSFRIPVFNQTSFRNSHSRVGFSTRPRSATVPRVRTNVREARMRPGLCFRNPQYTTENGEKMLGATRRLAPTLPQVSHYNPG